MSPPPAPLKFPAARTDGETQPLLPIFLKLVGRRVLVVGGGPVAATKVRGFKGTGAEILVVAPGIGEDLRALMRDQAGAGLTVQLVEREFQPADLDGAWLAIAAAPPDVNRQVGAAAAERRIFVVAADDPSAASAYGGGVVRRGGVTVAISTDGEAPALAGLLREALDAVIPADVDAWAAEARALRPAWRAAGVPMSSRRPLLLEALNRLYAERSSSGGAR
jgi:uroporphyrin-III C-methyltransferase/precorrin-2 dehydrogenase/sirohydrochlorin ferrochelatase